MISVSCAIQIVNNYNLYFVLFSVTYKFVLFLFHRSIVWLHIITLMKHFYGCSMRAYFKGTLAIIKRTPYE